MATQKHQILADYVEQYSGLAEQGTDTWKEDRQLSIGGSEVAAVIGKSAFSSVRDLVAEKVGLTEFTGNMAVRWGSLFEDITEAICSTVFGVSIYHLGSVPHPTLPHRYSPDGLCVMMIGDEERIVLLEFKSPLSSIPGKSIPAYYVPQVRAGLCTISIAERGLFMSNVYRRCSFDQLGFGPEYDECLHSGDRKKRTNFEHAAGYGIVLFCVRAEDPLCSEAACGELAHIGSSARVHGLIDLGACDTYALDDIFKARKGVQYVAPTLNREMWENAKRGRCGQIYAENAAAIRTDFKIYDYAAIVERYKKECTAAGFVPLAVLPWKLFRSSVVLEDKDHEFLNRAADAIENTVAIVEDILEQYEDGADLRAAYEAHFPPPKVDYSMFA